MANVTVYAFTGYHIEADNTDHRPVKATRATIAKLAGAVIIEASAEEVDASLLDGQGFYSRKLGRIDSGMIAGWMANVTIPVQPQTACPNCWRARLNSSRVRVSVTAGMAK